MESDGKNLVWSDCVHGGLIEKGAGCMYGCSLPARGHQCDKCGELFDSLEALATHCCRRAALPTKIAAPAFEHFLHGSCWCEPAVQGLVVKHNL